MYHYLIPDVPKDGEMKLFYDKHNADSLRGLLQVWLNGHWGTVSNSSWTNENSKAVCNQLGRKGELTEIIRRRGNEIASQEFQLTLATTLNPTTTIISMETHPW